VGCETSGCTRFAHAGTKPLDEEEFRRVADRIEALFFLFFLALLVQALLEREIRRAMKRLHIESLPLYPRARRNKRPTAELILRLFTHVQRHVLVDGGRHIRTFEPELSGLQEQVLGLIGMAASTPAGRSGAPSALAETLSMRHRRCAECRPEVALGVLVTCFTSASSCPTAATLRPARRGATRSAVSWLRTGMASATHRPDGTSICCHPVMQRAARPRSGWVECLTLVGSEGFESRRASAGSEPDRAPAGTLMVDPWPDSTTSRPSWRRTGFFARSRAR
jgi:hypothetical protein